MAITTNREYLQAALSKFNLTADDIELIMVEYPNLEGSLDAKACKEAIYSKFSAILPVANVSEGGFSVSWNIEAIKMYYQTLCNELGKPNMLKPKIRNRSNFW